MNEIQHSDNMAKDERDRAPNRLIESLDRIVARCVETSAERDGLSQKNAELLVVIKGLVASARKVLKNQQDQSTCNKPLPSETMHSIRMSVNAATDKCGALLPESDVRAAAPPL